ncbi:hypothetical protein [Streptomyces sp. SP18CS02]|uniref:hypothetical protein n=1 Tax=Streptomyces sp. SP18CS02 TaxID=3002531 RepID=UPI002E75FCF7|nr:hypothetical protein [Streptomyces sp. SP18CS02]MEE1753290.1 hypothetical protein [Streptomyces sp. SP18CS02]
MKRGAVNPSEGGRSDAGRAGGGLPARSRASTARASARRTGKGSLAPRGAPPRATVVDLDERGRLLVPGTTTPVPANRVAEHLARHLTVPRQATDIHVYVHGWQTPPATAARTAAGLVHEARSLYAAHPDRYPGITGGYRPWCVAVRWPSSSRPTLGGYRTIRDRAHAMSAGPTAQASYVLAHLLGYLDAQRAHPDRPDVLANRNGQYLHLVGHSFGGRFLCEAVQRSAEQPLNPRVLGWSAAADPRRPFTADSALIFQMAAPRDAFDQLFPSLFPAGGRPGAPLSGPLVLTHSRWDRATGFWHLRAEGVPGIGHTGTGVAPVPQFTTRIRPVDVPYALAELDHRIVNVDASPLFRGSLATRLAPAGAHSDFRRPESAHLLLSLASLAR